ncbi:MAG: TlpA disulfide reductase family protein [Legionellales bacterium]
MAFALNSQAEVLLHDTHGQSTAFSTLKGQWVFINYWAGWCRTCVDEIPEFNRFYLSHKKDPVAVYAVNYDALPLVEQEILIKKLNISYPSLMQNPANELHLGDIIGVPVTFIFNPKGTLVKTLYGGQTAETLNQAMVN